MCAKWTSQMEPILQYTSTKARNTIAHPCSPQLCIASVGSCCYICRILLFMGLCAQLHIIPAWHGKLAALSQLSTPETSGISLGVSQNSPKAPLISYSCCTSLWQQVGGSTQSIPLGGGRDVGGTSPGVGGFLIPGETPTTAENQAHTETKQHQP